MSNSSGSNQHRVRLDTFDEDATLNAYLNRRRKGSGENDTLWEQRRNSLGSLTDDQLVKRYGIVPDDRSRSEHSLMANATHLLKERARCKPHSFKKMMNRMIPITRWLPQYLKSKSLKRYIVGDIMSGLTVGIVALPQAMAYAFLAKLPAVNGLFVQFFPVIAYALFGTSRHISIGTFAVVSLMIGAVIDKHVPAAQCDHLVPTIPSITNNTGLVETVTLPTNDGNATFHTFDECFTNYTERKVQMAVALTVSVAIIHMVMFIFRLGIITVYLSKSLVSGFTCGASVHVMTSQVPKLLGIRVRRRTGPLGLIKTYMELFKKIEQINWATTIISAGVIVFLVIGKEINQRYGKKIPFPIPWELLTLAATTVASNYGHFKESYNVKIVGHIPTGFQTTTPLVHDIALIFPDAFPIAIVIYFVSISLARLFATKHAYYIDSNQELFGLSMANIFSSFFACFPCASSLSRSIIRDEIGGVTQIASVMQALVMFIVLMWIAPLFELLPQCTLAAIVVVNLKKLLVQFNEIPTMWRVSGLDVLVWIVTWTAVVVLSVDFGLLIGVSFSLLTVAIRTQAVEGDVMVPVGEERIFRSAKNFKNIEPSDGQFLVFRFASPLYFANQDRFKSQLCSILGFDCSVEAARKNSKYTEKDKKPKKKKKLSRKEQQQRHHGNFNQAYKPDLPIPPTVLAARRVSLVASDLPPTIQENPDTATKLSNLSYIILDMRACSFVDNDGVITLNSLFNDLQTLDIKLLLANCKTSTRMALQEGKFPPFKPTDNPAKKFPVFFISVEKCVEFVDFDLSKSSASSSSGETSVCETSLSAESSDYNNSM